MLNKDISKLEQSEISDYNSEYIILEQDKNDIGISGRVCLDVSNISQTRLNALRDALKYMEK